MVLADMGVAIRILFSIWVRHYEYFLTTKKQYLTPLRAITLLFFLNGKLQCIHFWTNIHLLWWKSATLPFILLFSFAYKLDLISRMSRHPPYVSIACVTPNLKYGQVQGHLRNPRVLCQLCTKPRKGHFLSDAYQKRNWHKEIRTEINTKICRLIDLLYRLNDIISR